MNEPETKAEARPDMTVVRRFWWWLGGIAGGALVLRALIVLVQRPTVSPPKTDGYVLGGDSFYYHYQGLAIGDGLGFVDPGKWRFLGELAPSAYHPPLYSGFLGLVSRFGVTSVTGHRLASGLLGVASVVLIALVARHLAGDRAALIAGTVAALYPQLWINDGMVLSETIAITTTALALLAAYHCWTRPNLVTSGLLGAAIGLAALSRSELVLLFAFAALPLIVGLRALPGKRRLGMLVATAAAGLLVMSPWLVYTLTRFEKPVLFTTGSGAVLSAGSCDEVFSGSLIGYTAECYPGPWPGSEADESERDVFPREYATEYIGDHVSRLPLVTAARVGRLWGVFKPGQTTALDWSIEARGRGASWLGLACYYLLMPFAVAGVVILRRRRVPISPLVALAVVVTIAAAVSFGVTRYRAPAEVAIVIAAGVAADALWCRIRSRSASSTSIAVDQVPASDATPDAGAS